MVRLRTPEFRGKVKFLDPETIKREALKGITGRKPGDNLKNRRRIPHLK